MGDNTTSPCRRSRVFSVFLCARSMCLAPNCRVMALMGASTAADIVSEEFGDGNLNLVFRCR